MKNWQRYIICLVSSIALLLALHFSVFAQGSTCNKQIADNVIISADSIVCIGEDAKIVSKSPVVLPSGASIASYSYIKSVVSPNGPYTVVGDAEIVGAAPGSANEEEIFLANIQQTTYYRRIVTALPAADATPDPNTNTTDICPDTSEAIAIRVECDVAMFRGGFATGNDARPSQSDEFYSVNAYAGGFNDGFANAEGELVMQQPFLGGFGDGFHFLESKKIFAQAYLGGFNDGFTNAESPDIKKQPFLGGFNDGFNMRESKKILAQAYAGGFNDGFTDAKSPDVRKQPFLGGFNDGFNMRQSKKILAQAYRGGLNDGFTHAKSPEVLDPPFLGGFGDGFTSRQVPFPLITAYLGGLNDGFLWFQPRPEFDPTYTGGKSDGFAKRQVPCDTVSLTILADSLVCPGDTLFLEVDSIDNAIYFWRGPGGWTSSERTPFRPKFNQAMVGTYEVMVNTGCPGDAETWPSTAKYIDVAPVETVTAVIDQILPSASECAGTPLVFMASGTAWEDPLSDERPHFEWFVNNKPLIGAPDTNVIVLDSLRDKDLIKVAVYSSFACVNKRPFVSANVRVRIEDIKGVTSKIEVGGLRHTSDTIDICVGAVLDFVQSTKNLGNTPSFVWLLNGDSVTNAKTYKSDSLKDGDSIQLLVYSSFRCVDNYPAYSNTLHIRVHEKPKLRITDPLYIEYGECAYMEVLGQSKDAKLRWYPAHLINPMDPQYLIVESCPEQTTDYTVVVEEPWHCIDSASTKVYVISRPRIIEHADTAQACERLGVDYQVLASGVDLEYQWQFRKKPSSPWEDAIETFSGAETPFSGVATERLHVGWNPKNVFPQTPLHRSMHEWEFRCRVIGFLPEIFEYDTIYSNDTVAVHGTGLLLINNLCSVGPKVKKIYPSGDICERDTIIYKVEFDIAPDSGAQIEWILNGKRVQYGTADTLKTIAVYEDRVYVNVHNYCICPSDNPESSPIYSPIVRYKPKAIAEADFTIQYNTDTSVYGYGISDYGGKLTYEWTPADKLVSGLTTQRAKTDILQTPTWFYIRVTEDTYGCSEVDSVRVKIIGGPLEINPDTIINVCEFDTVLIDADPWGGNGNYEYSFEVDRNDVEGLIPEDLEDTATMFRVEAAKGTTVYTVKVTDGVETVERKVTIVANERKLAVAHIDGAIDICKKSQFELQIVNDSNCGTNPTYKWFVDNSEVAGVYGNKYGPVTLDSGSVVYARVYSDHECPLTDSVNTPMVTLGVHPMPVIVGISDDTTICKGSPFRLRVSAVKYDTLVWSPAEGLSNPNGLNPQIRPEKPTTYTVSLTTKFGCKVQDSVRIGILPNINLWFEPRDTVVCAGKDVLITDTNANVATNLYAWTPNTNLTNAEANGHSVVFNSTESGVYEYEVLMTTKDGCTGTDIFRITTAKKDVRAYITHSFAKDSINLDTVCPGDEVVYVLRGENLGDDAVYEWYVNGNLNTSSTNDTLRLNVTDFGTEVYCHLFISDPCASSNEINSQTVKIYTYEVLDLNKIDLGSDSVDVCKGDSARFGIKASSTFAFPYRYAFATSSKKIKTGTLDKIDTAFAYELLENDTLYFTAYFQSRKGTCEYRDTVYFYVRENLNGINDPRDTVGVCVGSELPLGASNSVDYLWTPAAMLTAVTASKDSILAAMPSENDSRWLKLLATDKYGCQIQDSIYLYALNDKEPSAVEICYLDSITYDLRDFYAFWDSAHWTPNTFLSSDTSFSPHIKDADASVDYELYLYNKTAKCGITVHPKLIVRQKLEVKLSTSDTAVCKGDLIEIRATASRTAGVEYTFSDNIGSWTYLDNTAVQNFELNDTCEVYVEVKDDISCRSFDTIRLRPTPYDTLKAKIVLDGSIDSCLRPQPKNITYQSYGGGYSLNSNGELHKTGSNNSWHAYAFSSESINTQGSLSYEVNGKEYASMIGLSYADNNSPYSYSRINYAIYFTYSASKTNNQTLQIYESGAYKGDFGVYNAGDVVKIERKDGNINYYIGSKLLRQTAETAANASRELFVDIASYHKNAEISAPRLTNVLYPYVLKAKFENAGQTPKIEWFINGNAAGTDSVMSRENKFHDADTVVLKVSSSTKCPALPVVADTFYLPAMPDFRPLSVEILENGDTCVGGESEFVAVVDSIPSGADLKFTWFRNGNKIFDAVDDSIIRLSSVLDGEIITCEVWVDNLWCVFNHKDNPATSKVRVTSKEDYVEPKISINIAPSASACPGVEVSLSSVLENAGLNPSVIWYVNGKEYSRERIIKAVFENKDSIYAVLVPSDELVCLKSDKIKSDTIGITILDAPIVSLNSDTVVELESEVKLWGEVKSQRDFTLTYSPNGDIIKVDDSDKFHPSIFAKPMVSHYYYISAKNDLGCVSAKDSVYVQVITCPNIVSRTELVEVCDGDSARIIVVANGDTALSYTWQVSSDNGANWNDIDFASDSRFVNLGDTLLMPRATADLEALVYRVKISGTKKDCKEAISGECRIKISTSKSFTVGIDGNFDLCYGKKYTYTAKITGDMPDQTAWYLNGVLISSQSNSVELSGVASGDKLMFKAALQADVCPAVEDSVEERLDLYSPLKLEICADTAIQINTDAQLKASCSGGLTPYTYAWTPADKVLSPDLATTLTSKLSKTQIYTLVVSDANGCDTTADVQVRIFDTCLNDVELLGLDEICEGEEATYIANVSGSLDEAYYSIIWEANPEVEYGIMDGLSSKTVTIKPKANPTVLTATVTDIGPYAAKCAVTQIVKTKTIALKTPETYVAKIEAVDATLCKGSDLNLNVKVESGGAPSTSKHKIKYFRIRQASCEGLGYASNSYSTKDVENGDEFFVLVEIDSAECAAAHVIFSDTIKIEVREEVFVPSLNDVIAYSHYDCSPDTSGLEILLPHDGIGKYEFSIDGGTSWQTSPIFKPLDSGEYRISVRLAADNSCSAETKFVVEVHIETDTLEPGKLLTDTSYCIHDAEQMLRGEILNDGAVLRWYSDSICNDASFIGEGETFNIAPLNYSAGLYVFYGREEMLNCVSRPLAQLINLTDEKSSGYKMEYRDEHACRYDSVSLYFTPDLTKFIFDGNLKISLYKAKDAKIIDEVAYEIYHKPELSKLGFGAEDTIKVALTADTLFVVTSYEYTSPCGNTEVLEGSDTLMITTYTPIKNNTIEADQVVRLGAIPYRLKGGIPFGGEDPLYTYKWLKYDVEPKDDTHPVDVVGSLINYQPEAITDSLWFRRVVFSASCSDTSNIVFLDITDTMRLRPSVDTICLGDSVLLSCTDTSYVVDWNLEYCTKEDFAAAQILPNSNKKTEVYVKETGYYRIAALLNSSTADNEVKVYSDTAFVFINSVLRNFIVGDTTICDSSGAKIGSQDATMADGEKPKYIWIRSTTDSTSGFAQIDASRAIDGIIDASWLNTTKETDDSAWYRRIAIGSKNQCPDTSNAVKVSVVRYKDLALGIDKDLKVLCNGDDVEVWLIDTNGYLGDTPKYKWYHNNAVLLDEHGVEQTSDRAQIKGENINSGDKVWAICTSSWLCVAKQEVSSDTLELVYDLHHSASISSDTAVCAGESVEIEAVGEVGSTYKWSNGATTATQTIVVDLGMDSVFSVLITHPNYCDTTLSVRIASHTLNKNTKIEKRFDTVCAYNVWSYKVVNLDEGTTVLWSTGETTEEINPEIHLGDTLFTVVFTDKYGCSYQEDSLDVHGKESRRNSFVQTIIPDTVLYSDSLSFKVELDAPIYTEPLITWYVNGKAIDSGYYKLSSELQRFTDYPDTTPYIIMCVLYDSTECVVDKYDTIYDTLIVLQPIDAEIYISGKASELYSLYEKDTLILCEGIEAEFVIDSMVNEGVTEADGSHKYWVDWYHNGKLVSHNASKLNLGGLQTGDSIYAILTCDSTMYPVPQNSPVRSNAINIKLRKLPVVNPVITGSADSICAGEDWKIEMAVADTGDAPYIEWYLNDALVAVGNTTYTATNLQADVFKHKTHSVYARVHSSDVCAWEDDTITSNKIEIDVKPLDTLRAWVDETEVRVCNFLNGEQYVEIKAHVGFSTELENLSMQWYRDGVAIAGETDSLLQLRTTGIDKDTKFHFGATSTDKCFDITTKSQSAEVGVKIMDVYAEAGGDDTVVYGNVYQLKGGVVEGGDPSWTSGGSGSFVDANVLNAEYMPSVDDSAAGFVWLYLTVENDLACKHTDSMKLTIFGCGTYEVDPLKDTAICIYQDICLGKDLIQDPNKVQTTVTYTWFNSKGIATLDELQSGSSSKICIDSNLQSETYYVRFSTTVNCTFWDTVTVTVNPLPDIAAMVELEYPTGSLFDAMCEGETAVVRVKDALYDDAVYSYDWYDGSNNKITQNVSHIDVKAFRDTTISLVVTNISSGCALDTTLQIRVHRQTAVNIGNDTVICLGDTILLPKINYTTPNYFYSPEPVEYIWTSLDGTELFRDVYDIADPSRQGLGLEIYPDDTTKYVAQLKMSNGCYSALDTFVVNVDKYAIELSLKGTDKKDTIVCKDEEVEIIVTGNKYETDPIPSFVYTATKDSIIIVEGKNTLGCKSSDTVEVRLYSVPDTSVIIKQGNCTYDTLVFYAGEVNNDYTYTWTIGSTTIVGDTARYVPEKTDLVLDVKVQMEHKLGGCLYENKASFNIFHFELPEILKDTALCESETLVYLPNSADYISRGFEIEWRDSAGILDPIDESGTINTSVHNSTLYLRMTDIVSGCTYLDTLRITMDTLPSLELGDTIYNCDAGATIDLSLDQSKIGNIHSLKWRDLNCNTIFMPDDRYTTTARLSNCAKEDGQILVEVSAKGRYACSHINIQDTIVVKLLPEMELDIENSINFCATNEAVVEFKRADITSEFYWLRDGGDTLRSAINSRYMPDVDPSASFQDTLYAVSKEACVKKEVVRIHIYGTPKIDHKNPDTITLGQNIELAAKLYGPISRTAKGPIWKDLSTDQVLAQKVDRVLVAPSTSTKYVAENLPAASRMCDASDTITIYVKDLSGAVLSLPIGMDDMLSVGSEPEKGEDVEAEPVVSGDTVGGEEAEPEEDGEIVVGGEAEPELDEQLGEDEVTETEEVENVKVEQEAEEEEVGEPEENASEEAAKEPELGEVPAVEKDTAARKHKLSVQVYYSNATDITVDGIENVELALRNSEGMLVSTAKTGKDGIATFAARLDTGRYYINAFAYDNTIVRGNKGVTTLDALLIDRYTRGEAAILENKTTSLWNFAANVDMSKGIDPLSYNKLQVEHYVVDQLQAAFGANSAQSAAQATANSDAAQNDSEPAETQAAAATNEQPAAAAIEQPASTSAASSNKAHRHLHGIDYLDRDQVQKVAVSLQNGYTAAANASVSRVENWFFQTDTIDLSSDTIAYLAAVMRGDVNEDYSQEYRKQINTPSYQRQAIKAFETHSTIENEEKQRVIDLPVYSLSEGELLAQQIYIDYNPNKVEILGVQAVGSDTKPVFNIEASSLKISHIESSARRINKGDTLFIIKINLLVKPHKNIDKYFRLNTIGSEFLDAQLQNNTQWQIALPKLSLYYYEDSKSRIDTVGFTPLGRGLEAQTAEYFGDEYYEEVKIISVIPNPSTTQSKICYYVPQTSIVNLKLYSVLGEEVLSLVNMETQKGKVYVDLNSSILASGVYVLRLYAIRDQKMEMDMVKIVVNR